MALLFWKGVIYLAYDVGVRNYLTSKGVASSDIDYDKNSGNVTIRKQPFYKPELNMAGSTYSSQTNLDNAYKTYSSSLPVIQSDGTTGKTTNVGQPNTVTTGQPTTKPTSYTNPYVTQYEDIMKRLDESNKAMQQPVDIYNTPEYAAARAQQDKAAHQSTRAAQESMGASGFGRSTNLADRAQGIQNEANDYLQTQLVPQIQTALQNKNQQQYNNLLSQFNTIYSLVNQADNQHQNEVTNANNDRTFNAGRQDAATEATGIYNPSGLTYQEVQSRMDKNSADYAAATAERKQQLHDENMQLADLIGKKFNDQTGTYSGGQGYAGTKTIQAKTAELTNQGQVLQNQGTVLSNKAQEQQNILNQYKIDDYPAESKAAAQKVQQELTAGQLENDTAKFKLNELKDPNSLTNKAARLELQVKEVAAKYAEPQAKAQLDQILKATKQIGAAPYQSPLDKKLDQVRYDTAVQQLYDLQHPKPAGNSKELNAELDGLYTGITSGQLTASSAIDEVNSKVKAGLTTPAEAAQMLALINSVNSTVPNIKPKLTQDQIDANGGSNPQDLNTTQLDKLWNTDPSGKAAGRPSIDWGMWYTDPRGKVGGISYEAWKQAYGPQMSAGK